jgi:hypothetical protein
MCYQPPSTGIYAAAVAAIHAILLEARPPPAVMPAALPPAVLPRLAPRA